MSSAYDEPDAVEVRIGCDQDAEAEAIEAGRHKTPLDRLETALKAVALTRKRLEGPLPIDEMTYLKREEMLHAALGMYHKAATEDTIASLVAVARRAERNSVCVCGKVWRYENHKHAEDCPLVALIEEVPDDRA